MVDKVDKIEITERELMRAFAEACSKYTESYSEFCEASEKLYSIGEMIADTLKFSVLGSCLAEVLFYSDESEKSDEAETDENDEKDDEDTDLNASDLIDVITTVFGKLNL